MKIQTISRKIILSFSGIFLLLVFALPQTGWAFHGDRVVISGFLGGLDLVFIDGSHRPHHKHSGRHYYREKSRYRDHGPVVNTNYRHHRRPVYERNYCYTEYSSWHPSQRRHHPKRHHHHRDRHRHPRHNHNPWR